jgi:hypothetical protein
MSRYRVWEANRKVFLYPENWIEPGLRHDKSPFFQDMENDLLQSEVTTDSAEDAFQNYLTQLDAVARLDVVGTYYEASSPARLHVVARKQGDPPTHYYRQWVDSSRWTAWTKVQLDIVSDHVLPVVWNRRLYLFWAIVQRKPDRAQTQPPIKLTGSSPPDTKLHLEVQLAWSELKGKKWLAKQTAPQVIVVPWEGDPFQLTLKSSIQDPLLRIDVFSDRQGQSGRQHVAEFVLGGVGNAVEAFALSTSGLDLVGPDTRAIGTLDSSLARPALGLPTNTAYSAMSMVPTVTSGISGARPRVSSCSTTYDLYGTLTSEVVLNQADFYRLLVPHQSPNLDSTLPFFVADAKRSYFLIPQAYYQNGNYFTQTAPSYVYHPFFRAEYSFVPFYHAFVPLLIRELNRGGVDALYQRQLQADPAGVQGIPAFDFGGYYSPTDRVIRPYPGEGVDFEYDAGYAIYNWELFFHAPFQIAEALSRNQRFEDAKHWYEHVFDPTSATDEPAPSRYWVTKPFRELTAADYQAQQIVQLTKLINQHDPVAEHQVAAWRANPFDPHVIAELRPVAYQRAIVMKYIDNLIAWGDQLFRQDTMESVNEATQLYVLAAELYGPQQEIVERKQDTSAKTYAELESSLDEFGDAIGAAENALAPVKVNVPVDPNTAKLPVLPPLYFCIPPNDKLLSYWDTIADRLFKIRHGLNIEGVARQLALFAPPIDPALLVRAAAAGLDLGSVLADASAALSPYRFRVILREALDLAQDVRSLGAELLSVLEKRDAEALALLRSGSERKLQDAVLSLREQMMYEAAQQLDALDKSRAVAVERQSYYAARKDELMNAWEAAAMGLTAGSAVAQGIALGLESASGAAHIVVDAQFGGSGAGGSPHVTVKFGGPNVGHSTAGFARAARVTASLLQTGAAMSTVLGGYQHRQDEMDFQYNLASKELDVIASQKLVATIRQELAKRERDNQERIATLAADVDELLHSKFTNDELYEWSVGQTSATHFQAYGLAFTVAKRAEMCLRHELGLADSSFIQFGYWDSLKKGLLAGDKLVYDLQRMEAAYLSQNARELELTKHASLLQIDPYALVKLRATGQCIVTLPELWFDIENPGHFMRRLKTVAVTVPCVVGPYGGVSMTLTLLDNHVRTSSDATPPYKHGAGTDDRFIDDPGGVSAVVTSTGQNDSGLFELSLQDERYLPFEGSGAISTWKLKLNAVYPQFDYRTITDVLLHLRYTARDGGEPLASAASDHVRAELNTVALAESRQGLYRLLSARHEYGSAWQKFLDPGAAEDQVLTLEMPPDRFPFFTTGLDIKVTGIDVLGRLADPGDYTLVLTPPGGAPSTLTMSVAGDLGGLHHADAHPLTPNADLGRAPANSPAPAWTIKLKRSAAADFRSLTPAEIDDLVLVFQYTVTP